MISVNSRVSAAADSGPFQGTNPAQYLGFAFGLVGRGIAFGMPGLLGKVRPCRQQLHHAGVDGVNLAADVFQGYSHARDAFR